MHKRPNIKTPVFSYRNVLIEKHKPNMKFKVVIRKCFRKKYWYKTLVGNIFVVTEFKSKKEYQDNFAIGMPDSIANKEYKKIFFVKGAPKRAIRKRDCDVIK